MDDQTRANIGHLQLYLANLPAPIPLVDPTTGTSHPITFREQGQGLEAVADVLKQYITQLASHADPEVMLLIKWLDDLISAAENTFKLTNIPLPQGNSAPTGPSKHAKTSQKATKQDTKNLGETTDPNYEDLPEIKDMRKGSVQLHPLLLEGSQMCKKITSGESADTILVRCIGSKGCGQTWAMPQSKQHIMGHLVKCGFVDAKLHQHACDLLASQAIGPEINIADMKMGSQASQGVEEDSESEVGKVRTGRNGGKLTAFVGEGKKQAKEKCDYHVMKFIVCSGIPPTVVDSDEWKELMHVLHPFYQPPSSLTLTSTLIVNKAAKISMAINQHLSSTHNLTITFDGDDGSQLGHTAQYILEVIGQIQGILGFMSHSMYVMEQFNHIHSQLGLSCGLESIGDTHFGTLFWVALSIQHNLQAFQTIVEDPSLGIAIGSYTDLFMPGGAKYHFKLELSKLLQVTGPWAKGTWSLEAAHVTADQVYYIFLAIMAQHEEDFQRNEYQLKTTTMEDIRQISNGCFDELVNEMLQSHDIYITAFVCNPVYCNAPVYQTINPLAIQPITISQKDGMAICQVKPPDQFKAYICSNDPFRHKMHSHEGPLHWWNAVARDEYSDVLSVSLAYGIFSTGPVSMADEHTQSTITWLNSPYQNQQQVGTLQDHIKIHQWNHYKPAKLPEVVYKPLISWRDMETTILGKHKALAMDDVDDLLPSGNTPLGPVLPSSSEIGLSSDEPEWLDGPCGLPTAFYSTVAQSFTLLGCDKIDL
ncbi:hypothetical protein BKA82DRAFT_934275 [Pisolithus tinctorius]|uniref:Uncharacterized protein n=1 Tax=Pisolithus tinctorius Marx 270 TaxID=870435 RepID=A0A0C3JE94_PISTI|nr:hypothetical protein BKA82DRAFT_934275 [Pisolithus tinctorius]KIN95951.1 hypothetical protein M404DRAFT_934275 [Pisolithus tinctorius Marx 270]